MPKPPPQDSQSRPLRDYRAEKARGARIVLNTPARRLIFFGGLIALVIFILLSRYALL